jgi:hypothetical protein
MNDPRLHSSKLCIRVASCARPVAARRRRQELIPRVKIAKRRRCMLHAGSMRRMHSVHDSSPRNRPTANIVGAANLGKRFLAMIAAQDRLALLVAHFHAPRLGAFAAFAFAGPRRGDNLKSRVRPFRFGPSRYKRRPPSRLKIFQPDQARKIFRTRAPALYRPRVRALD